MKFFRLSVSLCESRSTPESEADHAVATRCAVREYFLLVHLVLRHGIVVSSVLSVPYHAWPERGCARDNPHLLVRATSSTQPKTHVCVT